VVPTVLSPATHKLLSFLGRLLSVSWDGSNVIPAGWCCPRGGGHLCFDEAPPPADHTPVDVASQDWSRCQPHFASPATASQATAE
jgi:hypothetical protein